MTDSSGSPVSATEPSAGTGKKRRAGRNVPVATAVGVTLAALVLVTLYTVTALFVALVVVAVVIAVYEVCQVLSGRSMDVPVVPLMVGGAAMVVAAYVDGTDALTVALVLTIVAMAAARLAGSFVGREEPCSHA